MKYPISVYKDGFLVLTVHDSGSTYVTSWDRDGFVALIPKEKFESAIGGDGLVYKEWRY